ncbi:MAG: hypothetical protein QNJ64_05340 [Crocosphaera sp.]|nr:hypothetical protein [Crocosphaera sp.]
MYQENKCSHLTTLGLSLATLPLLGGLCMLKAIEQDLLSWGVDSEEVFRGDRLPLLNFPHSQNQDNS